MTREAWHGTLGGYDNHNCRCRDCKDAKAVYQRGYRERMREALAQRRVNVVHGTSNAYHNYGCRCRECKEWRRLAG